MEIKVKLFHSGQNRWYRLQKPMISPVVTEQCSVTTIGLIMTGLLTAMNYLYENMSLLVKRIV